jgi:hypothetical protein
VLESSSGRRGKESLRGQDTLLFHTMTSGRAQ